MATCVSLKSLFSSKCRLSEHGAPCKGITEYPDETGTYNKVTGLSQ